LWGSWLCYVIDHKRLASSVCAIILSVFSLFGIVHSVYLNGTLYIPTHLPLPLQHVVVTISLGYLITGILTWILLSPRLKTIKITKINA
nr:hypothetical protein [Burkholderiales bacterium]